MNTQMVITLIILSGAAIFFISGRIRSDLVAICSLILLVIFNILSPSEALSGFSNSVVIMMIGLFVVGGGIFQTGLAKMASGKLLKLAGTNETRLLITVMITTSMFGAFVSNTGTVAVMLPIVVSLAMSANINPNRLLMPLAFASALGGSLTLIGTPPNLVIREVLTSAGYDELSFFSYTPIGLVALITGTLLIILFSKLFLPRNTNQAREHQRNGRSLTELAQQYKLTQNIYRLQVGEASSTMSKQLVELDIHNQFQVHILDIRRRNLTKNPFFKSTNQVVAGPTTAIQKHDILYVYGAFAQVEAFADAYQLEWLDPLLSEQSNEAQTEQFATSEVGIAEVLIAPNSKLTNQFVKHTAFRENYHVTILGIQRSGDYLLHQLKDEKLRVGDALLIQGAWDNIARLSQEQSDVVVVGQPLEAAAAVPLSHKAPIAAMIMLCMVLLMIFEVFPAVVSVMIAAVLMVVTGCLRSMEAAYKSIDWESIVLIGGMIPMSIAIEHTGAATLLSEQLVAGLGSWGPMALLAGIYFATSMLTLFISNTACAVLFAPIALTAAVQIGVSPVPFMFAVSISASMCFAVPFSTPPNALVMSAGRYKFKDYIRVGLPIQILLGVVMVIFIPLFFPF